MKTNSLPSRGFDAEGGTRDPGRRFALLRRFGLVRGRHADRPATGGRVEQVALALRPCGKARRASQRDPGRRNKVTSSGLVQGSDSSGRRYPMGESPGMRNICFEARNQGWLVQRGVPERVGMRRNGST